jgi:hypothetical protein
MADMANTVMEAVTVIEGIAAGMLIEEDSVIEADTAIAVSAPSAGASIHAAVELRP